MTRWGLAAVATLQLVAGDAFAATRYDITNMACPEVQALVEREGAVILSYRSSSILGLPIYDLYVKNRQYCDSSQVIRRAGVPTTDKKYCPVKKCVESQIFVAR
ncbi:MAG: hypothetical protein KKB66_12685 [Alphaproteobacteria bacterium]|jgi:hypothetical protein|nr:hypothetical protein [Alphaproteobacteria bacterium]MBU0805261.1 hypothetical protein [Alphaproteobacteria bacterium]MBU0870760.1 hypothetical protein [Alphaproteobacteria bacterium]MBU1401565.1 hypothetical protein [Alphaproteobacteria bacterium]MBU1592018.1 hypothetical protein [Alphaproteobacteria bacterium]